MFDTNSFGTSCPNKRRTGLSLILALGCLVLAPLALAQQDAALETEPEDPDVVEGVELQDNLGRDTPRTSFIGFLAATEKFDYEAAVDYIDLRNLPFAVRQIKGD